MVFTGHNGFFITFEGVEGSGKSTQIGLLCQWLQEHNMPAVVTREPGGTPFGREVRTILLNPSGPQRKPLAELLLYLADRYQDIQECILPALKDGQIVLCDRYHDATIAYQGFARGISMEAINTIASSLDIIKPNLTILLDVSPESALRRAKQRNLFDREALAESRFEEEELSFHQQVRQGYLSIVKREPERFVVLAAGRSPNEIFEELLAHFLAAVPTHLRQKIDEH